MEREPTKEGHEVHIFALAYLWKPAQYPGHQTIWTKVQTRKAFNQTYYACGMAKLGNA